MQTDDRINEYNQDRWNEHFRSAGEGVYEALFGLPKRRKLVHDDAIAEGLKSPEVSADLGRNSECSEPRSDQKELKNLVEDVIMHICNYEQEQMH